MKNLFIFALLFILRQNYSAQLLLNGDFSLGTLFWGCGPETNAETTYGGSNGLNTVAEVDAVAGLCQTVSGLTIGKVYSLSFDATRRTGSCPGPLITNVDITINGGVLIGTVTRTNTTFGFTNIGYLFTATGTSHTITFAGGSGFGGNTCGMIIDNISVAISGLPIEILQFEGIIQSNAVQLAWSTATEKNNARFEIERSSDGSIFENITSVTSKAAQGNSSVKLNYETRDPEPLNGTNYYRLKQVDADQGSSYSKLIAVTYEKPRENKITVYPNPNNGEFTIDISAEAKSELNIKMVGYLGRIIYSRTYQLDKGLNTIKLDLKGELISGNYRCLLLMENKSSNFPVVIE